MDKEKEKEKLTIVMFSGDLDRALAGFMLATTGASMGMDVNMYFTFWGLDILKKNDGRIRSKGILRKALHFIDRGGPSRLRLSNFHLFGLGTRAMRRLMKESKVPTIEQFITMAQEMGVKMIPCNTTCKVMGLPEDAFRDGISPMAGAAFFLGEARKSQVVLFI
ncbi:MAG: DsrE/DsrF/DrsH-like family protein [Chloroflexi bacterium]|nr:DsrE/DsrF/DrsH-like family protein [Chloroflexota bacterium]